uniref:Putative ficolin/ixoderin n=1 Tax=Ixodes ricinus TaxID=34613 RepID=A0A0K8REX5_IXORI
MFVAFLLIPVVAGNVFAESNFRRVPEITERQHGPRKTYMLFDPCNTNKPGNRTISCSQIQMKKNSTSGVYTIQPLNDPVKVMCDMTSDGGGWTVIQSRTKHERTLYVFDKSYQDYEEGFGSPGKSFWIGNKHLHALTSFPNNQQALRIELTRKKGENPTVLHYRKFHVGTGQEKYKLTIGEYDGLPGTSYDALSYHNNAEFTTKNWTNVYDGDSCSGSLSGGWWFKDCNEANLNGLHSTRNPSIRALGITWHIKGRNESYMYIYDKVEMKIRDADFGFCTGSLRS